MATGIPDQGTNCSGHMRFVLSPENLRKAVSTAVDALRMNGFGRLGDSLAFRGASGMMIASAVAYELGCGMILVRKAGDASHSNKKVEGDDDTKRYVIIDDFQSSGNTAREVMRGVFDFAPDAVCLGVLPVAEVMTSVYDPAVKGFEHVYGGEEVEKELEKKRSKSALVESAQQLGRTFLNSFPSYPRRSYAWTNARYSNEVRGFMDDARIPTRYEYNTVEQAWRVKEYLAADVADNPVEEVKP